MIRDTQTTATIVSSETLSCNNNSRSAIATSKTGKRELFFSFSYLFWLVAKIFYHLLVIVIITSFFSLSSILFDYYAGWGWIRIRPLSFWEKMLRAIFMYFLFLLCLIFWEICSGPFPHWHITWTWRT